MTPNKQNLLAALSRIPGWPPVLTGVGETDEHDPEHIAQHKDAERLWNAFPDDWLSMDADGWRSVAAGALAEAQSDWGKALSAADVVAALQEWVARRAKVDEVMEELNREEEENGDEAN